MDRFAKLFGKLNEILEKKVKEKRAKWAKKLGLRGETKPKELFGLDCHDLSLENVFVDENENWKIVCPPISFPYSN